MKKITAMILVLALALTMALPASAITPGKWDFGAAQRSVQQAVQSEQAKQENTVTYDLNGGFIWNSYASPAFKSELSYTATGTHTVVNANPIRPLYKFSGWEYNGTIYKAGDTITLTGDVTLTAVWVRA